VGGDSFTTRSRRQKLKKRSLKPHEKGRQTSSAEYKFKKSFNSCGGEFDCWVKEDQTGVTRHVGSRREQPRRKLRSTEGNTCVVIQGAGTKAWLLLGQK